MHRAHGRPGGPGHWHCQPGPAQLTLKLGISLSVRLQSNTQAARLLLKTQAASLACTPLSGLGVALALPVGVLVCRTPAAASAIVSSRGSGCDSPGL